MSDLPTPPPGWNDEPPKAEPTIDSPLSDWLTLYVATNPRITSAQTGRRYWTTLNNLEQFFGYPPKLTDLTPDTYGGWVRSRRDSRSVSPGTIRGEAEKLVVIWRWAAARCGLSPPVVSLPPRAEKTPEAWLPDEVSRLYEAARRCTWWVGGTPANRYFPAVINLAIETGERLGAIYALEWSDLDLERRVVTFRAETRKGGARDARKPIGRETVGDLELLKEASPSAPFRSVKATSLYPPMRRLLHEAGLPPGRNNMFHAFRRYHATQVCLAGGDATAALGHSDPSLARKSYIDPAQLPVVVPSRKRPGLLARLRRSLGGGA